MKTTIYKGVIRECDYGENWGALFIGESEAPLAEILEETITHQQVSVRYWTSDKEKTKEELQEGVVSNLFGSVNAEYCDRYSEITGYLWTDEELKIGGHDLMKELKSYVGKYILLEIDIH